MRVAMSAVEDVAKVLHGPSPVEQRRVVVVLSAEHPRCSRHWLTPSADLRQSSWGAAASVLRQPVRQHLPGIAHYGVPLWVPEVGGPIDPDNEAHDLIMSVFGGVSKGERNRIKIRVRTAMAAQAQLKGRFLGDRPPYGYRLIDAGPPPNPAKAADGRRLHALALDDPAATVVARIFGQFIAGMDCSLSTKASLRSCLVQGRRPRHPHQSPLHRSAGLEQTTQGRSAPGR